VTRRRRDNLATASRLAIAALATGAVVLGIEGAASADSVTKKDRTGDAPAWADISRVTYRNGATNVGVRLAIPHLARRGVLFLEYSAPKDDGDGWVKVDVAEGGPPRVRVYDYFGDRVRCGSGHARWSVNKHVISVSVSHRCVKMGGPGALYLDAFLGSRGTDVAPAALHLARN
jgi:hypothetical protein